MATQAEIAAHLDISTRRLSDIREQLGIGAKCSLDHARVAYIRWLRERAAGREESGVEGLTNERIRLTRAQADKTQLEAAELRGEMVYVDDVIAAWGRMLIAMRSRLLAMPTKIGPRTRSSATDQQAAKIIEEEVIEALEELSDDGIPDRTRARRERWSQDDQATAEADGVPVGGSESRPVGRKRRRVGKMAD